ncbi:DUF4101 domain-containing protein [Cyanobium sp. WKJ7-Wakatipu]|uniref:IMS domain-containing protein n=1 Tax=Cyanobium sp. WKJ7-Wakatipu TaxID=2823726 RepID=UPI0020CC648E|nr:IMS domain-containing protein [Cyanobium sp. WKJ7-Wakatipu]MCP9784601.1 DUF4101 domain-containing protein [Cyanobium sp. WKJ7-Wakatipu]
MRSSSTAEPDRISDQQLGCNLAALIAQQASSNLPFSVIYGQLQDLLGDDTALLGPLRDLLGRPAFQQLLGLKRHSVQLGARDALLQDLALTYNAGMVVRLAVVIDGCIGLPPGSVPPMSQQSAYSTQPFTTSPTSVHTQRPLQGSPSLVSNSPTPVVIALAGSLVDTTCQPLNSSNNDEDVDASHSGALLETIRYNLRWPRLARSSRLTATAVGAVLVLVGIASVTRPRPPSPGPSRTSLAAQPAATTVSVEASKTAVPPAPVAAILPLRAEAPSEAQVQALLAAWLDAKTSILAGKNSRIPLDTLARPSQLDRLRAERDSDKALGETQSISTDITKLVINERDANRIAATVGMSYTDQRLNSKGDPQGEPSKMELRNLYVFGRDGGIWRLVSFQKAP